MLLYVLGILIVLAGLALSIALHEIGHLVPAKLFGVKVTQYMIGFGRTLWSRKKGETEYGVKLLPFGGYVAMIGMYPPKKPGEAPRASTTGFLNSVVEESAGSVRAGAAGSRQEREAGSAADALAELERIGDPPAAVAEEESRRGLAGLADEARLASAETIAEGEDHRTFYRLPMWKKIVIMLGGPVMNLVLAFVFFAIFLVGFGLPQNSTTLGSVNECLLPASSSASSCSASDPAAPAAAAGLRPGDRIVSVDGIKIESWEQFREIVGDSAGVSLELGIERDGTAQSLRLTPVANERAVVNPDGTAATDAEGRPRTETVGMIGASPAQETAPRPLTEVPAFVGENIERVAGVIVRLPERMVDVWNAAFGSEARDPDGPMSVVGVGRLAGEVASLDAPVAARAQVMVGLLGSLNVALFVFNLVPLMPLDGGHVAGALYEGAKRGIARLRRKPDPGPIDTARMVPVTFAVVVILGGMSVLLMYADIVKPVQFFG
ncbi:site-2 protease family protein [Leucobacter massiliensis]|uniref:M50 family metallopeptidase n=1 Tax=Leucobacter massiliensis TaxID=1686285 RepID=UPI000CFEB111